MKTNREQLEKAQQSERNEKTKRQFSEKGIEEIRLIQADGIPQLERAESKLRNLTAQLSKEKALYNTKEKEFTETIALLNTEELELEAKNREKREELELVKTASSDMQQMSGTISNNIQDLNTQIVAQKQKIERNSNELLRITKLRKEEQEKDRERVSELNTKLQNITLEHQNSSRELQALSHKECFLLETFESRKRELLATHNSDVELMKRDLELGYESKVKQMKELLEEEVRPTISTWD